MNGMHPDQKLPAADPITLDLKLNQLIQRVDTNVTQEIIVTTADKVRLCLIDALGCLERQKAWIAPAGILATLVVVFPTTTFQDFLGFSKEYWRAMFSYAAVGAFGWLVYCLFRMRRSVTVQQIVERLRTDSLAPAQQSRDVTANDLPASGSSITRVLEVPRVPFRSRQNADFIRVETRGLKGFNLRVSVPKEAYWRSGFVLAPEDYIREGRVDVTIAQYFLFHIGRGDAKDPTEVTGLRFQVYQQERSVEYGSFQSGSPVEIHVTFPVRDGHLDVAVGDKHFVTDLDPHYLRHLYILAWADMYPLPRVEIELTQF